MNVVFRPIADVRLIRHLARMPKHVPSSFSGEERAFIESVADKLPEVEGNRLRNDVRVALIKRDGDFISVDLPGYDRPAYIGHRNLPYEGRMRDTDGGVTSVLVNMAQNNRLLEIEFIFWEGGGDAAPDWSTLSIVPEPPASVSR